MERKLGEYTITQTHKGHVITHPDKLSKVHVIGNGHVRETFYDVPDWDTEEHECFAFKGETYYLEEFMPIGKHAPTWMCEYDGYMPDSFFSGLLIRYSADGEGIQVYWYYC